MREVPETAILMDVPVGSSLLSGLIELSTFFASDLDP
jgi:hypothetical protein